MNFQSLETKEFNMKYSPKLSLVCTLFLFVHVFCRDMTQPSLLLHKVGHSFNAMIFHNSNMLYCYKLAGIILN